MHVSKAQSSVEWMLLLGAILMISLVVLAAASSVPVANSGQMQKQESIAYWTSQAWPLQLSDWSMKASAPAYTGANLTVVLYNPSNDRISIRKLTLTPGVFFNVYYSNGSSAGAFNALNIPLLPHDKLTLKFVQSDNSVAALPVSTYYSLNLTINYDGALGSSQQAGKVPIIGERN